MVNNIRQNPDMRDQTKCSECRRKKQKCLPRNRNWETAHQKCDNCKKNDDTPCGPNYKKKDDPAVSGSLDEVTAHEGNIIQDSEDQPRVPSPRATAPYVHGHNGDQHSSVAEESSGQRKRSFTSDKEPEELRKEAGCLLGQLSSLARSYDFGSHLTRVYCRDQKNPIKFNKEPDDKMKTINDTSHSLFMDICQLGLRLHEQGETSDACEVFQKLSLALGRYLGLGDDRKNGALRIMAQFYKDIGDRDEHEWMLTKATETHDSSIHQENPCLSLVNSLIETSGRADDELLKLWKRNCMVAEASLAIPPIQRSAQHKNAEVASILLARPNSVAHSRPALFNQEGLHRAATRGCEQTLTAFLLAGAQVDAPDLHNHTALFLAALNGHEGCCKELIRYGAEPNSRNSHGTTILEVAAGAGHLKVVQLLVSAGAVIDPDLKCCTSSPLQAAIENTQSPLDVALYLMGKNADVSIRRNDGKNAIELAEKRCGFLAHILRQKQLHGPPHPFDPPQVFIFDQTHLDFGPSVV